MAGRLPDIREHAKNGTSRVPVVDRAADQKNLKKFKTSLLLCEGRTFCPGGCGKASDPQKIEKIRFLFFIFSVVVVVIITLGKGLVCLSQEDVNSPTQKTHWD